MKPIDKYREISHTRKEGAPQQRRNLPQREWIEYIMHVTNEHDWIGNRRVGGGGWVEQEKGGKCIRCIYVGGFIAREVTVSTGSYLTRQFLLLQ